MPMAMSSRARARLPCSTARRPWSRLPSSSGRSCASAAAAAPATKPSAPDRPRTGAAAAQIARLILPALARHPPLEAEMVLDPDDALLVPVGDLVEMIDTQAIER